MKNPLRILHLEDSPRDAELIQAQLAADGLTCHLVCAKNRERFEAALADAPFDVILCDYSLPDVDAFSALQLAHEKCPATPVIVVSGAIDSEEAVKCLKAGAIDYLLKERLDRLSSAVQRAVAGAEEQSQRQQAEAALRESEARYRTLAESAQDIIYVINRDFRVEYINEYGAKQYGRSPRQITGRGLTELFPPETTQWQLADMAGVFSTGEPLQRDRQLPYEQGMMWLNTRLVPLKSATGEVQSILGISRDITERKRTEAQMLRAQRMESIGALAGGIAHDLNNILSPILMAAELLSEDLPSQDRKNMLTMVKGCAQRGSEMVKQILSFARGTGGQAIVLQVKPIVAEMARLVKDTFSKSIRVQLKIAPELPPVLGNATQLHQVLLNLCVNARDAMPNGGQLQIEAHRVDLANYVPQGTLEPVSGSYVVMAVSDTGDGMPPEVLSRVFEPFFTTKQEGKGTGVGLATVRGIVTGHNGFVEALSEVGKGTTFKVYLPAAPSAAAAAADQQTPTPPTGRGEQILVVDDEIAILEMVRETLEAFNYRVLMARNGAEALVIYRREKSEIQAIITDMMMPIMDGPTLIGELQNLEPHVKVIGISGLGSEEVLAKAGKMNVQVFLKKPYASASLLAGLREVLDGVWHEAN